MPKIVLEIYAYIAFIAAGFFILIQIVILVDWSYDFNDKLVEKEWFKQIIGVCVVLYIGSAVGIILMFIFFSSTGCVENILYPILTLVAAVLYTYLSLREDSRGALFPSAVVTAFSVYYVFSSLISQPDGECNPFYGMNSHTNLFVSIVGSAIAILSVGYNVYSNGSFKKHHGFFECSHNDHDESAALINQDVVECPTCERCYDYSFFHLVLATGSCYLAAELTNWSLENVNAVNGGWLSFYIKLISGFITMICYSWSLIGPILFPNRDWS